MKMSQESEQIMIKYPNLRKLVEEYVKETNCPLTVKELFNTLKIIPIYSNRQVVGFFGLDEVTRERGGKVIIIEAVYVQPKHRFHFFPMATKFLQKLSDLGYTHIETQVPPDSPLQKYIEERLHFTPHSIVYSEKLETVLKIKQPIDRQGIGNSSGQEQEQEQEQEPRTGTGTGEGHIFL